MDKSFFDKFLVNGRRRVGIRKDFVPRGQTGIGEDAFGLGVNFCCGLRPGIAMPRESFTGQQTTAIPYDGRLNQR